MKAIVSCDLNWGIGHAGELQVRIREDLQRFKALTTGKVVVYGRKTLATYPAQKPLPDRVNLVFSRRPDFAIDGARTIHSLADFFEEADHLCRQGYARPDFFVIGGQLIYELLLPYCGTVLLTQHQGTAPADSYFPNLDQSQTWELESAEDWQQSESGVWFRYLTYRQTVVLPWPGSARPAK